MLLTRLALRPTSGGTQPLSAGELIDLLWLNIALSDGVKHIHARTIAGAIEVAVFTVASEQEISDYIVRRVCERAVRSVPALHGWSVCDSGS